MILLIPNYNWSEIPRWKRPWKLLSCFWVQLTLSKREKELLKFLINR